MATVYPPLDDHTIVEDFVGASCSLQSILSRDLNWPPDIGYSPIPYHLVTRNTLHIQQSASETACSDRLSALPHWHVPSHTHDQQPLPWLVVYPYHPIIETWGTSNTNSSYPNIFIPTDELDSDDNPALFNALPESLRNLWGHILISPRYRYILYHTNKKIRIKAAVFLAQRLNNNTPYFVNLRGRSEDTPLPAPSAELTGLCEAFLTRCREVLLGRRRAFHLEDYTKWVSHNAAPVIPYNPDSQRPTYSAAPQTATPLPEPSSATTLPAAPTAPIPAPATTEPSPPQSTSSVSAFTQAIPPLADFVSEIPSAASDFPMDSPRDTTTPMAVDPTPVPPSTGPVDPTNIDASPSRPSTPRPITTTTKDRLIAPLILPPRPPPTTNLADIPLNGPVSITNCYAGLFARLPSLSQIYEAPHLSAQALYNFIFAPAHPLDVPQHPEPTLPTATTDSAAPDASMGSVESAREPAAPARASNLALSR